jgi:hypothetical protein
LPYFKPFAVDLLTRAPASFYAKSTSLIQEDIMKLGLILTAATLALSFTACSSKNKKEDAAKEAAPAVTATPTPAPVAEAAAKMGKKMKMNKNVTAGAVTCSLGSDVRMIEPKAADGGCELVYTKNGSSNSVATARNGMEYCQAAGEKLQKTLTDAGMDCK